MKFINRNNMPPNLYLFPMITLWLFLDRLNAPGWVYGVVFTVMGLISLAEVCKWFTGKAVDLVGNEVKPIKDEVNKN